MRIQDNIQTVKQFFAAMGGSDRQDLLALCAEEIEWVIPGHHWPLAGTHRGHAGLAQLLQTASETLETTFPQAPNSWRRETGFWSSVWPRERSRPRINPSRTTSSSPLPCETARWRTSGNTSTRRHWRGPPRWMQTPGLSALRPIPHDTSRKVGANVERRQRLTLTPVSGYRWSADIGQISRPGAFPRLLMSCVSAAVLHSAESTRRARQRCLPFPPRSRFPRCTAA